MYYFVVENPLLKNNIKPGYENIAPGISGDEDSKESTSSSNNLGKPTVTIILIVKISLKE